MKYANRVIGIGLVLLTMAPSACGIGERNEMPDDLDVRITPSDSRGEAGSRAGAESIPGILRAWEWVQSTGGALGDTLTPGTSERSYRVELLPGKRYRQISSADGVSEGTYLSTSGSTFNEPDVVVPVLRFDLPLFSGYFGPMDDYAVSIRGDTLELKDTSSHPWVHRYLAASANSAESP